MGYIIKIENKEYKGGMEKRGNLFNVLLDGKEFAVEVANRDEDKLTLIIDNKPYQIFVDGENLISLNGEAYSFEIIDEQVAKILKSAPDAGHKKEVIVTAPMPGLVIEIEVKEGDVVKKGQGLVIIEAMKMQNQLKTPKDGIVKKIIVKKSQTVNNNDKLIIIE